MPHKFEVFFSGRVQGVGFRYNACQVSRRYEVVGTVQNMPNGQVKMVVEGETLAVEGFIKEVCETTHGRVAETEVNQQPATGRWSDFSVIG